LTKKRCTINDPQCYNGIGLSEMNAASLHTNAPACAMSAVTFMKGYHYLNLCSFTTPKHSPPVYFAVLASFCFLFFKPCFMRSAFLSVLVSYLNFFFFFFGLSLFFGHAFVHTFFLLAASSSAFFLSSSAFLFAAASSSSSPGLEKPALDIPTLSMVTVVYLSSSTYSSSWLMGSGSWKPVNSSSSSSSPDVSPAMMSSRSPFACLTSRFTSSTCFSRSTLRCSRSCSSTFC